MQTYDAIVLGAGGVGSAALAELGRRGVRALGIDRFRPPHTHGSTHGQTRIIRQAYFEHPDYVPLLKESYRLWSALEAHTLQRLFHQIGLLEIGPPNGCVVPGVLRAAAEHELAVEELSAAAIEQRWPGLRVPRGMEGVFEPLAGFLRVEECVDAQLAAARAAGVELLFDTVVDSWSADSAGVRVRTATGDDFAAQSLIVTAGPWSGTLLGPLAAELVVRRKSLFWYAVDSPEYDVESGFPTFLFEMPTGVFYGFPAIDQRGVKVAEHSGGRDLVDPLVVDRVVDAEEASRVAAFLAGQLPAVSSRRTDHAVCLYTMSPDEHFLVDRHSAYPQVVFAAGLSGHGFKFTPVLGRALVELALDGGTPLPIEFLSLARHRSV